MTLNSQLDAQFVLQQLAALLIARQVIGNLKESAMPYVLEQMRLAKMSFDMFGALSPSEAKKELPSNETEEHRDKSPTDKPTGTSRSISQAELESSLFKVTAPSKDMLCGP
jgi:anoctamin-8